VKIMPIFHTPALHTYMQTQGAREALILQELRAQTAKMPEAKMQIGPDLGQFLGFLVRWLRPRRILEIGTYTGYSSLAMALASPPETRITTCDKNPEWTKIAQAYWAKAGMKSKIELKLAPALETLEGLAQQGALFDFIFIDADKQNYNAYFDACLGLLQARGVIGIDNTLWDGAVADGHVQDAATKTIRALNARIHSDAALDFALLPIDDGLTLVRKLEA
jgi:caffeoyl-CoA O-methyltransferase